MSQIAVPIVYALLIWWFSTGVILCAVRRSRQSYPRSFAVAGALLAVALWMLFDGSNGTTAWDAYVAFTGTIAVWGFVELTFLTGAITGSRRTVCPPGITGWRRARYATEAIIYHELALVAAGAAVLAATWNGSNRIALATFALLWVMRLSAKLNLFLGVRTLNDELLPRQLHYLRSYFTRGGMNPLFPISVIGSALVTAVLVQRAVAPNAAEFETAGLLLLASLLALALIEHAFMMVPMPISRLWGFASGANSSLTAETNLKTSPVKPT
jgi:putative photosynthetic complex assembly protein 2